MTKAIWAPNTPYSWICGHESRILNIQKNLIVRKVHCQLCAQPCYFVTRTYFLI